MTSRRVLKAAQAVREVVSTTILLELKDPRVRNVTVTNVEMSADLRRAKVYVSVMGSEAEQRLAMHGLRHASGYLQARLADRIQSRYTPVLRFELDQGVKKSIEISRLINEVMAESNAASGQREHEGGEAGKAATEATEGAPPEAGTGP